MHLCGVAPHAAWGLEAGLCAPQCGARGVGTCAADRRRCASSVRDMLGRKADKKHTLQHEKTWRPNASQRTKGMLKAMHLLLDSLWRATADCVRPRVVVLSLLPLLVMVALALALGYFYWDAAVASMGAFLESSGPLGVLWGVAAGRGPVHDAGAGGIGRPAAICRAGAQKGRLSSGQPDMVIGVHFVGRLSVGVVAAFVADPSLGVDSSAAHLGLVDLSGHGF